MIPQSYWEDLHNRLITQVKKLLNWWRTSPLAVFIEIILLGVIAAIACVFLIYWPWMVGFSSQNTTVVYLSYAIFAIVVILRYDYKKFKKRSSISIGDEP